jgi:hypothetical protein
MGEGFGIGRLDVIPARFRSDTAVAGFKWLVARRCSYRDGRLLTSDVQTA